MKTNLMVLIGFTLYYNSNDFGVKYDQGCCAYVCGCRMLCVQVDVLYVCVQCSPPHIE